MKKAFSALLAAAMAVSAVPTFSVSAADADPTYILTFTPDKTTAAPGDTITYTVSFEATGEGGLAALNVAFELPDGLTYVNDPDYPTVFEDFEEYVGTAGFTVLPGYTSVLKLDFWGTVPNEFFENSELGWIGLTNTMAGAKTPMAKTDIITFQCTVDEDAEPGSYDLTLSNTSYITGRDDYEAFPTFKTSSVEVKGVEVTDITADKEITLTKDNEKKNVNAKVIPDDASDKTITYSSDKPSVATVDKDGNVTAVADGVANIISTASKAGITATTKVTVKIVHVLEKVDEVAATCEEDGTKAYWKCKDCGKLFSDADGKTEITAPETIPATGHDWGEWTVKTAATCSATGVEERVCKNDSKHTQTREIAKTDHTAGEPTKTNVVEATCGEAGGYDLVTKCTVCGEVLKTEHVDVPATGDHDLKLVPEVPATCEEDGTEAYYECKVCGKMFSDAEGKTEIQEKAVIKATGHDWGEWTVKTAATCSATGVEERVCKNDSTHTETRDIEKIDHTAGEPVKENEVEATCGEAGGYDLVTKCTVCGEVLKTEHVDVPATGEHDLELVYAADPSCTEAGQKAHYKCKVCGKLFSDEEGTTEVTLEDLTIEATGHDWGEWEVVTEATETTTGLKRRVCKNDEAHIEEEIIPATGDGSSIIDDSSSDSSSEDSSDVSSNDSDESSESKADSSSKTDTSSKTDSKAAASGSTSNPGTGAAAGTAAAGIAVLAALAVVKKRQKK